MGRRRRRRRYGEASISAMPSSAGNVEINEASAMLLYDAPSGIAVFSFDEACLNNSVKDFWADIPQLNLEFFLKHESVSTPIDLVNDYNLIEKLTRLCGSEKKLVVGSTQHKEIIEKKLRITCLLCTSLTEEKSETGKTDFDGEELVKFLRQHNFDVRPEMVNKSIEVLARSLLDNELCEMEHLKFFRILLRDFIVKSGIDTMNWRLFHFATVLKMICCPGSQILIFSPDEIFSRNEYRKILANASRYKKSFSKIGVFAVYEDVISLYSKRTLLKDDLDLSVEDAKSDIIKINEAPSMLLYEAPSMLLYEAPSGIAIFSFDGACHYLKDFWAAIPGLSLEEFIMREKVPTPFDPEGSIDDYLAKRLTWHCGSEKKLVVRSEQHRIVIEKKLGITCQCVDVPDRELIKCSFKNPMATLLPEEKSETSKRDFDVKELITFLHQHGFGVKPEMVNKSIEELARSLLDNKLCEMEHLKFFCILLRDFIVKSGIDTMNWRLFHFATVLKMICCPGSSFLIFPPDEIFPRDEYRKILANASQYKTSFSKIDALSVYEDVISLYSKRTLLMDDLDLSVADVKGNKQAGGTGDQRNKLTASGMSGDDTSLKKKLPEANGADTKNTATPEIPKSVITSYADNNQANHALGGIPESGMLRDLIRKEKERDANEASARGIASSVIPPLQVSRRSKVVKQLCMPFICGQPVH